MAKTLEVKSVKSELLHQVEANLSALIESTDDFIWSVDLDFGLITFNRALERHLERAYGVRVAMGMRAEDLLPPERAAIWAPMFERVLTSGPFRTEIPFPGERTVEMSLNRIVVAGKTIGISIFGKDVTERRAAADAQALLASVVESSNDSVITTRLDSTILTWNSAAEALFGYLKAETIGKSVALLHAPGREHEVRNLIESLLNGGVVQPYSTSLRHKNGEDIDVSLSLSPIRDSSGAIIGVSGIARDLRERKRVDLALEEAENKFRNIFDNAREGMFQSTPGGQALVANQALAAMLGYASPAEFVAHATNTGENIWLDAAERARCLRLVDQHGFVADFECQLKRRDGALIWVSVTCKKILGGDGKTLIYEGFIEDITERKRAESALRESGHFLKEAQAVGGLGSYVMDLTTMDWVGSETMEDIFGIGGGFEYTLKGWTSLIHPDDLPGLNAHFQSDMLANGQPFNWEYRIFRHSDGEMRWIHGTGRLDFDAARRPVKLSGLVKDITRRKQAEQAMRESQELTQSTIDALSTAICVLNESGTIVAVNRAWRDFSRSNRPAPLAGAHADSSEGSSLDEGANYLEVCDNARGQDAAEAAVFAEGIRSVLRGDARQFSREYPCDSPDEARWFIGRVTRFFPDSRARVVVEHIDITALKQGEALLKDSAARLIMSEERYRSTFEQAPIGIAHTSNDGHFLRCNARFAEIIGYPHEEVPGLRFQQITAPEDIPVSEKILNQVSSDFENTFSWEKRYVRKDGSLVWVRITTSAQCDADGRIVHHIALIEDIDSLKAAERRLDSVRDALRISEARYRIVFQTSFDGILINRLDDGRFIDANPKFLSLMGYEHEEVMGRTAPDLKLWVDEQLREQMFDILRLHREVHGFEAQFRKRSGETCWALLSASVSEIDGVPCLTTIARDISTAKAAEDEIRHLAFYDSLTGLPNRRLLLERLQRSSAIDNQTGRMRALLFVDLDNFKTLNDTLGHQTGDVLLKETARRLKTCVRETDTVGRLGGDEFVLMLDELSQAPEEAASQARAVAEKILAIVSRPYLIEGRECRSSASIGISVFADQRENTGELLQQADIAMYQAKAAGRNTMRFFAPALQAAVHARAAMEQDLRHAIKAKQFVLYFQPQIDRNLVVGAEALVRWNHPSGKLLGPAEFIPLAEETGFILPLGKWVLDSACEQIAAWSRHWQTARLSVAVNISARQFRQPDFVQQVLNALERTGSNPGNLGLELTESMLVENIDEVIDKMKELKSYGLKFSLDDFGTGYSSLAYLKKLPLSQLKIDRSFIRDILTDESSAAIAQTIISLSRAMGLPVIAEGVETEEQQEFLTRLGCHAFQGFLYGRPIPLEQFEAQWLPATYSALYAAS